MFKSKAKIIAIASFIFVTFMLFFNTTYGKYMNIGNLNKDEVTNLKLELANGTKDFKDTHEISFKVEDSPNVANGKIAPGLKAIATIEIDLNRSRSTS